VLSLVALNRRQLFPKRPAARGAMLNQLWDGLTYSFSTPTLGFQMVIMAFIGTFAFNFGLTLPLLARFALDAGSEGFGVLNMALGIGAVIGGLVLATRLSASLRLIVVSATLFSLLIFSLGLAPSMPTAVVLVALTGALSLAYSASANTLLQMEADDRYRGRVLGLFLLLWSGSTPMGSALIGWLSDRYDIRLAMQICGAMCLLGVGIAVGYLLMARRRVAREELVPIPARLEDV
jgi:MFS family permease